MAAPLVMTGVPNPQQMGLLRRTGSGLREDQTLPVSSCPALNGAARCRGSTLVRGTRALDTTRTELCQRPRRRLGLLREERWLSRKTATAMRRKRRRSPMVPGLMRSRPPLRAKLVTRTAEAHQAARWRWPRRRRQTARRPRILADSGKPGIPLRRRRTRSSHLRSRRSRPFRSRRTRSRQGATASLGRASCKRRQMCSAGRCVSRPATQSS
mmetsp:Transcript_23221/g.55575  ORF Transcript_23221/g.55575 Transcript_23221/m.55575 type:complete len:212 (+) Transcript_23221:1402-2037(+)